MLVRRRRPRRFKTNPPILFPFFPFFPFFLPASLCSDVGTKQKITEFVCLAMETSTGRQLGRFARFVRLLPTAAAPPTAVLAAPCLTPEQMVQRSVPPQQLPQPSQLPQPHEQQLPAGAVLDAANGDATQPPVQGVENPLTSAVPLPDLLQELQQWMASLGLNPGPRDAAGFSELGNFRCVGGLVALLSMRAKLCV